MLRQSNTKTSVWKRCHHNSCYNNFSNFLSKMPLNWILNPQRNCMSLKTLYWGNCCMKTDFKSKIICILKSPCHAFWKVSFPFSVLYCFFCSWKRSAKLQSPISMSKGVTHLDTTCLATSLAHLQAMSRFLTVCYYLLTRAFSSSGTSLCWEVWGYDTYPALSHFVKPAGQSEQTERRP